MRLPVAVMLLTSATALTSAPASTPVQRLAAEVTGDSFTYTVNAGDTWAALGARYGVEPAVLARRNGRAPGKPLTPGEPIVIDNRHIAWPVESAAGALLVINVPQRMLFRMVDGRVDAFYPVAVGRADWRTPRGPFTVLAKEVDPTWDVPVSIQEEMRREGKAIVVSIPPCPANPLGRHWIRLSHPGVGLHGTNVPGSIYRFATHGCIRLHPDDVASLFERVNVGDAGITVYDPVLLARLADGRVFAEVHPDPYKQGPDPVTYLRALAERTGITEAIDWGRVGAVSRAREASAVDVTRAPVSTTR